MQVRNVTQISATLTLTASSGDAQRYPIVCSPKRPGDLRVLCGSATAWAANPTAYTAHLSVTLSYFTASAEAALTTATVEGRFIRGISWQSLAVWAGAEWIGLNSSSDMAAQFRSVANLHTSYPRFTSAETVAEAFLFVSGLGGHRVSINGRPVDPTAVRGSVTEWSNRTFYFADDVTADVQSAAQGDGLVAVAVELYKHWYGLSNKFYPVSYGPRSLKAVLVVTHADGSTVSVNPTCSRETSGCSWQHGSGATLHEDLHTGQTADGRRATPGWELPQYTPTESQWAVPVKVRPPPGQLRAHPMQRSRVLEVVRPISVTKIVGDPCSGPGDTYRFTLPHEVAGFCTLVLDIGVSGSCPSETVARFRHGEAVNEATGFLVPTECTKAFSANHTGCEVCLVVAWSVRYHFLTTRSWQNTSYVCRGNSDGMTAHEQSWRRLALAGNTTGSDNQHLEAFTPAFQFSAFRFVEITYDGPTPLLPPTIPSLTCYRIGVAFDWVGDVVVGAAESPNQGTGTLNSDSAVHSESTKTKTTQTAAERFNTVVAATRWTAVSNYLMDVPTDCPHREKRGWAGDSLAAHEALASFFDVRAAWTKWIDDMVLTQRMLEPVGTMPSIIPCIFDTGSCRNDPRTSRSAPQTFTDVAWGSVLPLLAAYTANLTGDIRIATRSAPAAVAYVELLYRYSNPNTSTYPLLLNATSWPATSLGDWCPPEGGMSVSTLLNSHHLILDTDAAVALLKSVASKHGAKADPLRIERLAQLVATARTSFAKAFLHNHTLPPLEDRTTCGSVPEHESLELSCGAEGASIANVSFAGYGLPNGTCAQGLEPSLDCFVDVSHAVVAACVGHRNCSIECVAIPHQRLCAGVNFTDPCPGIEKHLSVSVVCDGTPPPPSTPITGLAFSDPYPPASFQTRTNHKPSLQTESASGMAAMAVAPMNLLSDAQRADLGDFLASLVLNVSMAQVASITGGVIDMNHLAPELVRYGRPDAAFALLSSDGSPSYFNMANYGGTLWENWANADTCDTAAGCTFVGSLNHIMYGGSVSQAVFGIGGITPLLSDAQAVGIAPVPWLPEAPRGGAVWRSGVGEVSVAWSAAFSTGGGFELSLNATVPAGAKIATIEVVLPRLSMPTAVCVDDCTFADAEGPFKPGFSSQWTSFDAGGGHYESRALLPSQIHPPVTPPSKCVRLWTPQTQAIDEGLPFGIQSVRWKSLQPGYTMFPSITLTTGSGTFAIRAYAAENGLCRS